MKSERAAAVRHVQRGDRGAGLVRMLRGTLRRVVALIVLTPALSFAIIGVMAVGYNAKVSPVLDPKREESVRMIRGRIETGGVAISRLGFDDRSDRLYAGDLMDGGVQVWDATTCRPIAQFSGPASRSPTKVTSMAISPDGRILAAEFHWLGLSVIDTRTGEVVKQLTSDGLGGADVAFTPDGTRLLMVEWDGTVRAWRTADWSGRDYEGWTDPAGLTRLAISPDGRTCAIGGRNGLLRLYDLETGTQHAELAGGGGSIVDLVFSRDGRRLAFCTHRGLIEAVQIETSAAGDLPVAVSFRLQASSYLHCMQFSPDDELIACGFGDGAIRFLDARSGDVRGELDADGGGVQSLAFSPDGRTLASGSNHAEILLWDWDRRRF